MNRQSSGDAFIQSISSEALQSTAVHHPYLEAISECQLPDMNWALRDFAYQYGLYTNRFIPYLSAVTDSLSQQAHKNLLLSNLAEEKGDISDVNLPKDVLDSIEGQPHSQLYRRFQHAVGVDSNYRESAKNQPQAGLIWSQQFMQLCQSSEYVGIGAIGIGTELIVSSIYSQILKGIEKHGQLTLNDRVFFDLHSQCDDEHGAQMLEIATDLAVDNNTCEQIEAGARRALEMRVEFWDQMLQRAHEIPTGQMTSDENLSAIGY